MQSSQQNLAEKIEFLAEYCRLLNETKAQIGEIKIETDVKDRIIIIIFSF